MPTPHEKNLRITEALSVENELEVFTRAMYSRYVEDSGNQNLDLLYIFMRCYKVEKDEPREVPK